MTTFQKLIGTSALIVACTIAYYFLVTIPERDLQKQEFLKQQREQNLESLKDCLLKAEQTSTALWASQCPENNPSCTLSLVIAQEINKQKENHRELCFKAFPSN